MGFVYEKAITKIVNGTIDLANDDIRVALVGSSTTADTEQEIEFLDDFTTLDELTSVTNYVRKALASLALNEDLTNNRVEFDAENVTWTALGGASNGTIHAAVVYLHVTNDTDSVPIAYLDNGGSGLNQATNGSDVTLNFNAEGIIQFTRA